jgi:hypothetical protein
MLENFENLMPSNVNSPYALLDSYPVIGKLNENTTNLWKKYPIYTLPTPNQTTNNIRYPNSPDDGTCYPLEFCGAFYGNKNQVADFIISEFNRGISNFIISAHDQENLKEIKKIHEVVSLIKKMGY